MGGGFKRVWYIREIVIRIDERESIVGVVNVEGKV
jgi:hypothetical protein